VTARVNLREINERHLDEFREQLRRDGRDVEAQYHTDVRHSYKRLFDMTVGERLRIQRRPLPGGSSHRRLAYLEIGFGTGVGFDLLRSRYGVDEDCLVGIEVIPAHYKAMRAKYPRAHLYLLSGDPEELPRALDAWADAGQQFQLIVTRHVMEHQPGGALLPILSAIRRLLVPHPRGVYVQVTPDWRDDPEPAHLSKLPILYRPGSVRPFEHTVRQQQKSLPTYEPVGWPKLFFEAGLGIAEAGKFRAPAHHMKCEWFIEAVSLEARKEGAA
jgi:phospholipid N-methyltransferase